ncbi:hypothetical protein [Pseudokineococcus sp. 1T1Z-3]|uniref:hypothetical protein n=1 Tax=Pseudokineococcus sp. 1T1Z-3 TaxID=3132745 RepID=UPI0030A8573C
MTGLTCLFLVLLAAPLMLTKVIPLDDVVLRPVLLTLFGTVAVTGLLDRAPARQSKANKWALGITTVVTAALITASFYLAETWTGLPATLVGLFLGILFTYIYWRAGRKA